MKSIKLLLPVIFVLSSFLSAATFNVSNVTQFQNALTIAQANGQDDIIYVAAGTYNLTSGGLTYNAAENKSLVIQGTASDPPILDGGNSNQIMNLRTYDIADDSSAHITVAHLIFRNGKATDNHGGGLAVLTDTADFTLLGSRFSGNTAKYNGGGANVSSNNGTIAILYNAFFDNSNIAGGPSYVVYSGGGLVAGSTYGVVDLYYNIFVNNSAVDQGGGALAHTYSGIVNVINNIFRGNHSTASTSIRGAGAYFNSYTGSINLTNNTFNNNSAVHGGGFYITMHENSATANIYNNIIWGNIAVGSSNDFYIMDDREWDYIGSTVNLYHNNYSEFYIEDGDNLSQANNINADPRFTPSFHLQTGSPSIDAGTNSAPNLPSLDFEDDWRIIDGNFDSTAIVDIGADENDGSQPVPVIDGHDFSGNGESDIAVWRSLDGYWYLRNIGAYPWGTIGDIPVSGNYDADVATEIGVWRPSNGYWYLKDIGAYAWGISGDIPVPGDYSGDSITDIAVWRPTDGIWYVMGISMVQWGTQGDIPIPGDYDGDHVTEMAVWRPSNGYWYIKDIGLFQWGTQGDIPVPADYNGDGTTDIAVWRPSNGVWYIMGIGNYQWGTHGDVPVCGDFNGDNVVDVAIWRPANGVWYVRNGGTFPWGTAGDMPVVR